MAGIGDLVVTLGLNAAPLTSGLAQSSARLNTFSGGVNRSLGAIKGALGLLGPIAATVGAAMGFGAAIQGARDAAAQQHKLEAVLKATGGAAGLTAGDITGLANQLEGLTNFEDDATIGAAGVLATFKNIKGDQFKAAISSAQDLSSVMGMDLQAATVAVGKALNDPMGKMKALAKVGVSFTDQQKTQIKVMQESGDILGAQGVILGGLKSSFGGAAQAMADPLKRLQNVVGNVGETIGGLFLPSVNALASGFSAAMGPLAGGGDAFTAIGQKIGNLVSEYIQPFVSIVRTGFEWITSGVGQAGPAVEGFTMLVKSGQWAWGMLFKEVDSFFGGLQGFIASVQSGLSTIFQPLFESIGGLVSEWLPNLNLGFSDSVSYIGTIVESIGYFVRNMSAVSQIAIIDLVTCIFDNLPGAEGAFVQVGAVVVGVFSGALAFTKSFVQNVIAGFQEIGNFAKSIFAGVAAAFSAMLSGKNPLTAFQDSMTATLAKQQDAKTGGNPFEQFQKEFAAQRESTIKSLTSGGGLKNQLAAKRDALAAGINSNEAAFALSMQAPTLKPPPTPNPLAGGPDAGGGISKDVKVEAVQRGSKEAYSAIQSFLQSGKNDTAKQQLDETIKTREAAERQADATEELAAAVKDSNSGFGDGGGLV